MKLDSRISTWIREKGWEGLRPLQQRVLDEFSPRDDILVIAGTAAGKTEAAFFPVLTNLVTKPRGTVVAIYPLTALINDQLERLSEIASPLGVTVIPWHGEASVAGRKHAKLDEHTVVLITPESLESAIRKSEAAPEGYPFNPVTHVILDEYHTLLGTSRGHQTLSLLSRLEMLQGGLRIPRLALSATIGSHAAATTFLRPSVSGSVKTLEVKNKVAAEISVDYVPPCEDGNSATLCPACMAMYEALFQQTKNRKSLLFPNARRDIERLAIGLTEYARQSEDPLAVFVHHASVSRALRRETEVALQEKNAVAVLCSSTLEMGVDLPNVDAVVQIGVAPSVSALRQRMGRSGREHATPRLHLLSTAASRGTSNLLERQISWELVSGIAQATLALEGWTESETVGNAKLSALAHQALSLLAGFKEPLSLETFEMLLTGAGNAFQGVGAEVLEELLTYITKLGWIEYLADMRAWRFSALGGSVFASPSSLLTFSQPAVFRVYASDRFIGELSRGWTPTIGAVITLGGRGWRVTKVGEGSNIRIDVLPTAERGVAVFSGMGYFEASFEQVQRVHALLSGTYKGAMPTLSERADTTLKESIQRYETYQRKTVVHLPGEGCELRLMAGSRIHRSVCLAYRRCNFVAVPTAAGVHFPGQSTREPMRGLKAVRKVLQARSHHELISESETELHTWSFLLPPDFRKKEFIAARLADEAAKELLGRLS